MTLKKRITTLLCMTILSTQNIYANDLYLNNNKIDADIIIENNSSYINIRDLANHLQMDINYNKETGNIYLNKSIKPTKLIAHAGGEINNLAGTNSKEAIINSINKGFNLIEIDFGFTSDDKLVAIHDFEDGMSKYFKTNYYNINYEEFMKLNMVGNLTQLSIDGIIGLMDTYPDLYIITDTKYDNEKMLKYISVNYPSYIDRFIPQVYFYDEYFVAKDLGFKNIILTIYKQYFPKKTLAKFAKKNKLFAITMPYERAQEGLSQGFYEETNTPILTHTVNDSSLYQEMLTKDVFGIYTDTLDFGDIKH